MAAHKETGAVRSSSSPGASRSGTPSELAEEMPEVDHFLGSSDMLKLGEVLANAGAERMLVGNPADWVHPPREDPRVLSQGRWAART
jgi:ribosomal protein S12 methylthiotransferase